MMGQMGWGGGWFGMGLWWLVFVVVAVVVVVALSRRGSAGSGMLGRESARDVLDRRYAAGEIGRDEYEQKKRDLQS